MSDTPRTDEVQKACKAFVYGSMVVVPDGYPPHDPWELSRILERENNEIIKHNLALLEALEAVEWESDGYGKMYCPACDNYRTYGHKSDCKLGNAIKKVRG